MIFLVAIFVALFFVGSLIYQISPAGAFVALFVGMSWLIVIVYDMIDGDGKK